MGSFDHSLRELVDVPMLETAMHRDDLADKVIEQIEIVLRLR